MANRPRRITPENKSIARHAHAAFGGTPRVQEHLHDTSDLAVDILRCADRPVAGVTAYSTIGLSDHPVPRGEGTAARLELCGACSNASESFANILAAAAFCIIRTGRFCHAGAVLEGYVADAYPTTSVPHLYLTAAIPWEGLLGPLDSGAKRVSWLLALPISEAERASLEVAGDGGLRDLLARGAIDLFDLNRIPAIANQPRP